MEKNSLKLTTFVGLLTLVSGSFFHFVPNNSLRAWGLTLGLQHNDHIIIGSVLLIVAFTCIYRVLVFRNSAI